MNGRWGGETAGHALDASARWATGVALPTVCCARRTDEPVVGLTLDDGPHPELTDAILDVLVKHEAQATFFLIGDRVVGNERVVRRIVDEGHEVGDHLMHDEPSIRLSRNPGDRPGLAAITADMLDEGCGDRSALDVHEALGRIGAQLETDVGHDATVIGLTTLPAVSGSRPRARL